MTDSMWQTKLPPRLVVEFPNRLPPDAIAHYTDMLDKLPAGAPIVLADGARIRTITSEGEVSPPDITDVAVTVSLPWLAFLLGALGGSFVTALAFVVGVVFR